MDIIKCQHEWVNFCRLRYLESTPDGYWFEKAHYPLSEKLGGKDTIDLWYPDHIVQGCLQTLEYSYPCIHSGKRKLEVKVIERVYPNYLEVYWEAYYFCQKFANSCLGEKLKDPEFRDKWSAKMTELALNRWSQAEFYQKMLPCLRERQIKMTQAALSEDSKRKRLSTFSMIDHQKGDKNSQFGTMWVTDGTKEGNIRIKRGQKIPEGYRPGRVCK